MLKSSPRQRVLFLLLLSLLIRLLAFLPLHRMQMRFDEREYFRQAVGYERLAQSALQGEAPARKDVLQAYNGGGFLPLNSILIGLGFLFLPDTVFAARLIVILFSVLTTLLVFLTARKLLDERAAFFAALLHALFPSFICFSHYLWSETLFILVLFLVLYIALVMMESGRTPRLFLWAALLGFVLGLLALTRGAALALLFFFPIWLAWVMKGKVYRILVPLTVVFTVALTLYPWERILFRMERKFVVLSTIGNEYSLYTYNNPFVRRGSMYASWDDVRAAGRYLKDYSVSKGITQPSAARVLVMREITHHFPAFVKRTFENVLQMWTVDFFPMRQVFNMGYPPLPPWLILLGGVIFFIAHAALLCLALIGFFARGLPLRKTVLVLGMVVVGSLPYLLMLSHTRYNLPQVALLLPFAGYGALKWQGQKLRLPLTIAVAVGLLVVCIHTYANNTREELRPSSYYHGLLRGPDKVFPGTEFKDQLVLIPRPAMAGDRLSVRLPANGRYRFLYRRHDRLLKAKIGKNQIVMNIVAEDPDVPLRIEITSRNENRTFVISPLSGKYWRREREIIPGKLALVWNGGL